jgi:hypothetical protein
MRDYTHLAIWFYPATLGSVTQADVAVAWSDDGSTIAFDDNSKQLTDFDITNHSDGTWNPKTYTARFTTAGGELVATERRHLVVPKGGGKCRVGVMGDNASGTFTLRAQRLVM